jgi:hypothetical protein
VLTPAAKLAIAWRLDLEMPGLDDLGPTARAALEAYQKYFEAEGSVRRFREEHRRLDRDVPSADRKAYKEAFDRLRRDLRTGRR